jgi:predicted nucleic acid-binding protein
MVLVDSSVWIEGLRRKGSLEVKLALEGLLEAYEAQWSSPIQLEVMGGAKAQERKHLEFYFSVIPFRRCEQADWERGVAFAWKIRDAGITVPWLDALIASIALHDGVRVYSIDRHFSEMARVSGLQLYEPGYGGKYTP